MNWLFKEEPAHYSFDDLVKDGRTRWSGVRNPLAQKHLRSVRKGDRILYYHTGGEKEIVGIATAVGDAYGDPGDPTGRRVAVDIAPMERLRRPVSLQDIKKTRKLAKLPLVRIPRLSVMPVDDREWEFIVKMSGGRA